MDTLFKLFKDIYNASTKENNGLIESLLNAISGCFDTKICSLWFVNATSQTVSIASRVGYYPAKSLEIEYVHGIDGSLIGYVLSNLDGNCFLDIQDVTLDQYLKLHRSPDRVNKLGLKRLISIPIPNLDTIEYGSLYAQYSAVLNMYINDDVVFTDEYANFIKDQFSLTFSRSKLLKREELTRVIMELYAKKGSKDLGSFLHPVINNELKKFIRYEGCSIFIVDQFTNSLKLIQTTGIVLKGDENQKVLLKDVKYQFGIGFTGKCVADVEEIICTNVNKSIDDNFYMHEGRFIEHTEHEGISFIAMPIKSPSNPSKAIGVVRIVNKLNRIENVIDYFDSDDLALIRHFSNLLGFIIEQRLNEEAQRAFIKQITHEIQAPATAIRGAADILLRNRIIKNYSVSKTDAFLEDIYEQADFQIALNDTIRMVWSGDDKRAKKYIYQVDHAIMFSDIFKPSKRMVIAKARKEGVTFDNIVYSGVNVSLFIDKFALQQVFFNLFMNSIKYRDDSTEFSIIFQVTYSDSIKVPLFENGNLVRHELKEGFLIRVNDNGIGIKQDVQDKIFHFGFRDVNEEDCNISGHGIGLYIAKKIIRDFDGEIWVSNNTKPTQISIFLPKSLRKIDYIYGQRWQQTNEVGL